MKKLSKFLDLVVAIFIIIQPILDSISYLQGRYLSNVISLSSLIRTFFLGLMIIVLLCKDKRKEVFILLIFFITYLGGQVLLNKNSLVSSLNSLLTVFYLPVSLLFFKSRDNKYLNLRVITYIYLGYLSLIIIPYLFKYGNYASNFYEGKSGFYGLFYGGNEISNILVILLPLVIEYLKERKDLFLIILVFLELMGCIYLVGTKTIIIGSILVSIYYLGKYYKSLDKRFRRWLVTLGVIGIILLIIVIPKLNVYKNIMMAINFYNLSIKEIFSLKGLDKLVFSGRLEILGKVNGLYMKSNWSNIFLGLSNSYINVYKGIEIDIFDIFYTVGILGIGVYIYLSYKGLKKSKMKEPYLVSLVLGILISLVTGHVLMSPNVSIYLGVFLLLNNNSKKRKDKKEELICD